MVKKDIQIHRTHYYTIYTNDEESVKIIWEDNEDYIQIEDEEGNEIIIKDILTQKVIDILNKLNKEITKKLVVDGLEDEKQNGN